MVDAPSEPVVVVDDRGRRTVSWSMQVEDGPVTFTHDFPDAVRHHYEAGGPGEDLLLYAGAFSVDDDDGYAGDVRWRWGRRPHIEVRGHRPTTSNDLRELFDSTEGMWVQPSTLGIELLDGVLPAQPASLPQAEPEMDPPVRPVSSRSLSRRVEQELGTASALHHVTFLVPNGWEGFNGTGICDPTDLKRHWRGRTHAAGGGWQVILDQHADMSTDAWRELQDSAGYRFTHSGRLGRIDGSSFTGAEAFAALDRVRLGLNLALGRRTTCALPVGWRDGKPVWCRWRSAPVDSCSSSHWLDETIACKQVGEVVSLMLDFTSDEANLAAVRPALAYYVAGNVDVDVELAVAVPLSALQLLSYYRFVEQRQTYSRNQWKDISTTEDELRLLSNDLQVDPAVRPHFKSLVAVRDRLSAAAEAEAARQAKPAPSTLDALSVIVKMRNVVTHPTRPRPSTFDIYEWAEAGMHASYWLSLALLNTVGYHGQVAAVLEDMPRWTGQLRPPPWAP